MTQVIKNALDAMDIRFNSVIERDSVSFYSPRLALATLPIKNPKLPPGENIWQKDCGLVKIELVADWERDKDGNVKRDKETNLPVAAFPYGAFPRLVLIWLITEVVRTKRRKVVLGNSILDFLRNVGYTKHSVNYRSLEKQLKRLFSCQLTLFSQGNVVDEGGNRFKGYHWQNNRIASEHEFWWDFKEKGLFDSYVVLSEEFYQGVIAHAFPIDFDKVRLFHTRPFVLDIYLWLAYRVHDVNEKNQIQEISWGALSWQFGNYVSQYEFRKVFKKALKTIGGTSGPWKGLNLTFNTKGVQLAPSSLSVPASVQIPAPNSNQD